MDVRGWVGKSRRLEEEDSRLSTPVIETRTVHPNPSHYADWASLHEQLSKG
jgi:hypothetical protein